MNIKPIKTKAAHEQALARVESLWEAEPDTPEGDELDVLVTLIESFENEHYPIEAPDPVAAIKFRMEQQGLQDSDLVPAIGQRSKVSEVLNKKRKLSMNMIRRLNTMLNIPVESLISDYELLK